MKRRRRLCLGVVAHHELAALQRRHYSLTTNTKLLLSVTIVRPIVTYAAPAWVHTPQRRPGGIWKLSKTGRSTNWRKHHGSSGTRSSYAGISVEVRPGLGDQRGRPTVEDNPTENYTGFI
ncbi:hypothetical protein J6590_086027 [Homalodisca vitripennis]|nr:hypothetical protein J6590_086027 [Homalodisca vitripennis]